MLVSRPKLLLVYMYTCHSVGILFWGSADRQGRWVRAFKYFVRKYCSIHYDVVKWKHFPRYWPFVRGIHRFPVTTQRPVTRSFHVFFDLRLNERLSKQSWGWWLETLSCPLWRYRNDAKRTSTTVQGFVSIFLFLFLNSNFIFVIFFILFDILFIIFIYALCLSIFVGGVCVCWMW